MGVQVDLQQESPQPLNLSTQKQIMPTTTSVETQTEVYQMVQTAENSIEEKEIINSDADKYKS